MIPMGSIEFQWIYCQHIVEATQNQKSNIGEPGWTIFASLLSPLQMLYSSPFLPHVPCVAEFLS